MSLSNAFLTVAAGSTAVITALAVISIDDLPKKGRSFLMGLSLISTVYTTGNLVWIYAEQQKPNCPSFPAPPHVDQGVYIPPAGRTIIAPGMV